MSGRQSGAVDAALSLIGTLDATGRPISAYRAARLVGIASSTIYRATARHAKSTPGSQTITSAKQIVSL